MRLKRTLLLLLTIAVAMSGCTYDDVTGPPFSAYSSHDRKIVVMFPHSPCGIAEQWDPSGGRFYGPVLVYHFEGDGRTTVETNMCSRSTSSSGNWEARTKDDRFLFVDNSYMYPDGTPENELREMIRRDAEGNEQTIYLERLDGTQMLDR